MPMIVSFGSKDRARSTGMSVWPTWRPAAPVQWVGSAVQFFVVKGGEAHAHCKTDVHPIIDEQRDIVLFHRTVSGGCRVCKREYV